MIYHWQEYDAWHLEQTMSRIRNRVAVVAVVLIVLLVACEFFGRYVRSESPFTESQSEANCFELW